MDDTTYAIFSYICSVGVKKIVEMRLPHGAELLKQRETRLPHPTELSF